MIGGASATASAPRSDLMWASVSMLRSTSRASRSAVCQMPSGVTGPSSLRPRSTAAPYSVNAAGQG
jgi:hypothetical protein